jgi:membrane protein YdbS with pleckstrin-like domain
MQPTYEHLPTKAVFSPRIQPYLIISLALVMAVTVIGIPLAIIWCLGLGQWWARRYVDKLHCELNEHTLLINTGLMLQTEKSIALESIHDVTLIGGPVLRLFQLQALRIDTAKPNPRQPSAAMQVGIVNAAAFRDRILQARDALLAKDAHTSMVVQGKAVATTDSDAQLAALQSIQRSLDEILALLKSRQERSSEE